MAKSLLLNVLVDVLGNYVEGLSKDNLKLAVWSGTIELYNLKLKGTALDNLNLPIKVEKGSLKKLQLKIPWTSLESKPVTVVLDGIYLQASPLDLTQLRPEDSQRMILDLKRKRMNEAERVIMTMVQNKEDLQAKAKKATYVQQLTTKIVDNLEVILTNIHIRYEDAATIPGSIISCGVTIESLSLNTTDEAWSAAFVSREVAKKKETAIHKLGKMENCTIYWNTCATSSSNATYEEWESRMNRLIYSSARAATEAAATSSISAIANATGEENLQYLLAPPNKYSMRVIHREVCSETNPNLDVTLESTQLPFLLRDDQYRQLRAIMNEFADLDRRKLLITHRPQRRPTEDPRGWWLYALQLVTGRDAINHDKFSMLVSCLRARKVYVPYSRKQLVRREIHDLGTALVAAAAASKEELSDYEQAEQEKMRYFEETLPLSALVTFRQLAAQEAVLEIRKLRNDPDLMAAFLQANPPPAGSTDADAGKTSGSSFWGGGTKSKSKNSSSSGPKKKSGFFSSMFRSKSREDEEGKEGTSAGSSAGAVVVPDEADEKLMEEIEATFNKFSEEAAAAQDASFTLRAKLKSSATVSVKLGAKPVITLLMSMRSKTEIRKGNLKVLFEMDRLAIRDNCSIQPFRNHIMSPMEMSAARRSKNSNQLYAEGSSISPERADSSVYIPPMDAEDGDGDGNGNATTGGGSTHDNSTAPFRMCFESQNERASLRMKATPVKIVWNEQCIQSLLKCFTSPPAVVKAAPPQMLVQSMRNFTAEIGLPNKTVTDIAMEIYAPTFIFPEHFDADSGSLNLDTGKLLVQGTVGPDGMTWDVLLLSVNVALPSSSSSSSLSPTKHSAAAHQYLVQPFDIVVTARMSIQEAADVILNISVTPNVVARLDASKIVRLKFISDVVLRSLQTQAGSGVDADMNAEAPKDGGMSSPPPPPPADVDGSASSPLHLPSAATQASGLDTQDVYRKKLLFHLEVPAVKFLLEISNKHTAELSLTCIELNVVKRALDMVVTVNWDRFALEDSMRPAAHQAILWTSEGNSKTANALVASSRGDSVLPSDRSGSSIDAPAKKVTYLSITSPLSPSYRGHQSELIIKLTSVYGEIDELSTIRYAPFTSKLIRHYNQYLANMKRKAMQYDYIAARSNHPQIDQRNVVAPPPPPRKFAGSRMDFSMDSVSLVLLHEIESREEAENAAIAKEGEEEEEELQYEDAFKAELSDLRVLIDGKDDDKLVQLQIKSFDISDVRASSSHYVFNTLLQRNVYVLPVIHDATSTGNVNDSGSGNGLTPIVEENIVDAVAAEMEARKKDSILFVSLRQQSMNTTTIDIALQDVTTYVSVDIFMAFVGLINANVQALNKVLDSLKDDRLLHELSSSMRPAADKGPPSLVHLPDRLSLSVSLLVTNPRLLVLVDPTNSQTKAIVSDCEIQFTFMRDTMNHKNIHSVEVRENMQCALHDAQIFVVTNMEESQKSHKIVSPTSMELNVQRNTENGISLSTFINVSSDRIRCRVSLNDIVLTMSILARAKLRTANAQSERRLKAERLANEAKSVSTKTTGVDVATSHKQAPRQQMPQHLTVLTVRIILGEIAFVLLNDFRDQNTPMLRLLVDDTDVSVDGAVQNLSGDGSAMVAIDCYNVIIAEWEPVLEPWYPTLSLTRDLNGTELVLDTDDIMQFNISGIVLKCLYTSMYLVSRIGKEGAYKARQHSHPLAVTNQLGIPIEIIDSRTKQSIRVLSDDGVYEIPPYAAEMRSQRGTWKERQATVTYPDLFDLQLVGELGSQRIPVRQVSLAAIKPRCYYFYPQQQQQQANRFSSSAKKNLESDPIIEETFENQRYYPLRMTWADPWTQMSDPSPWTDSRGQPGKTHRLFTLPKGWEWVESAWRVEIGVVGVETDKDGWFYSPNFASMPTARKGRRAQDTLDVVRRRRWIRTRIPVKKDEASGSKTPREGSGVEAGAVDSVVDVSRPLAVFWEVKVKGDESREIHINSGVHVRNDGPCRIDCQMLDVISGRLAHESASTAGSSRDALRMMTVEPGASACVPFSMAGCGHVRIRPAAAADRGLSSGSGGGGGGVFLWSEPINCRLKTSEQSKIFSSVTRVTCADTASGTRGSMFFTVQVQQRHREVWITCAPVFSVFNALPCPISVLCANHDSGVEPSVVESGAVAKFTRVSIDQPLDISLAVGEFGSVAPIKLNKLESSKGMIAWLTNRENIISGDEQPELLCLNVKYSLLSTGVPQIRIFSEYVLIDQSDSGIIIKSDTSESTAPASGLPNNISKTDFVDRRSYRNEGKYVRRSIPEQLQTMEDIQMQLCWATGLGGVTMFQSGSDNKIALGVNCGGGWLTDVSLDSIGSNKIHVEIVDENSKKGYNLALSMTPLVGVLGATQVLRVMPAIAIVNYMDEAVDFLHPTAETWDMQHTFSVPPKQIRSWHRPGIIPGTVVRVRCESSAGSVGCIDINEIGTNLLILPHKEHNSSTNKSLIVAHVEVKFSEPTDPSYITVIIWRAAGTITMNPLPLLELRAQTPAEPAAGQSAAAEDTYSGGVPKMLATLDTSLVGLSIRNETDVVFLIRQDGIEDVMETKMPGLGKKFQMTLLPDEWLPYGWTDPSVGKSLQLIVGGVQSVVNTLVVNSMSPIGGGDLGVIVKTVGNGKVVHLFRMADYARIQQDNSPSMTESEENLRISDVRLKLRFKNIGASLVAERPTRREFFSAFLDRFEIAMLKVPETALQCSMMSLEVKARDIHVDNYSESLVYPVLLNSINSNERLKANKQQRRRGADKASDSNDNVSSAGSEESDTEYPDFFKFSAVSETPRGQHAVVLKYVAFRMLELKLAIDTSTILLFFVDLERDLIPGPHFIDSTDPNALLAYMEDFNATTLESQLYRSDSYGIDFEQVFEQAQAHKFYFEVLIIHPVKISLTLASTTYPRGAAALTEELGPTHKLRLLQNLTSMEDAEVKLSSFIVKNAMESIASMRNRILSKTVAELKSNMAQIAGNIVGSLTVLGKPAGLYKNIGSGVQDFFYEPYLGSMESPSAFVLGIGKGTGALLTGVASGVLTSAATIVGTATSGVSSVASGVAGLGGEDKYMKRREEKLRAAKASQGGVLGGLQAGGESLFNGVSSGITGLVTKPYEETKKAGAVGFVKGVGLGLIGVATRPVLGITDGISNVASGFTQQIQDPSSVVSHIRPPRAFERADPMDGSSGSQMLVPLELFSAEAQKYILNKAHVKNYRDEYLTACTLGFQRSEQRAADQPYGIVMSEKFLYTLKSTISKVWMIPCPELSHIVLKLDASQQRGAVEFIQYSASQSSSPLVLECATPEHALKLYATLARYSFLMGNPSAVIPVQELSTTSESVAGLVIAASSSSSDLAAAGAGSGAAGARKVARGSMAGLGLGSRYQSVRFGGMLPATKSSSSGGGRGGAASGLGRDLSCNASSGHFDLTAMAAAVSSTAVPTAMGTYKFGTVNSLDFPYTQQSSKEILRTARDRFGRINHEVILAEHGRDAATDRQSFTPATVTAVDRYYRQLDESLWRLVTDWRNNHNVILNPSRCAACLVINHTPNYVQVKDVELNEGKDYVIIGVGDGYDADSRSLHGGGGAAVFFAFGYAPTITNLAHVKLGIVTSAFQAVVSTRRNRSKCNNLNGFHAGFVEKNQADYWSKSVILIN